MDLIPRVIASAKEACQAAEAITAHRRLKTDERRKRRHKKLHRKSDLKETVMDIQEGQPSKRPRQEPGGGESSDDSGTVTLRGS
ncbi:PREDICTED: uncharacterized protein LOC107327042 [Acropora digitifera]|uniref:uncharacterized protein LOC107327042 n=1 Tax=Acropora digitifera TaxID=70779 RepID=UPI00077A4AF2|nr:PREDICTED: uncharacterized protein LOC107327042 [Acropora digitifera]